MHERGSFNIRHLLVIALGGNSLLHKLIDEMTKERKWEYYQAFRASGFFKDMMIPRHVAKNEEKMKQVAGIVEWCYTENDFEPLYKLIKKGYKFSYQYVMQSRQEIDLDHFSIAYVKRKGGMDRVSDLELYYSAVIVIYLCMRENKPCSFQSQYGNLFLDATYQAQLDAFAKEIRFSKENKEKHKVEVNNIFKEYGLNRNMKPTTVGKFLELFVEEQSDLKYRQNPFRDLAEIRAEVFTEGISKYIGAFSNFIKIQGINEMDLTESVEIKKEDVENLFLDFVLATKPYGNRIPKQDRDMYIVANLYLLCLAEVYRDTKRLYLDDSIEQHYLELNAKENALRDKEMRFSEAEATLRKELNSKDAEILRLKEEVRKLEKANQLAGEEVEKRDDFSKEVFAFREYLYSLEQEEIEPHKAISHEDMKMEIGKKRVTVLGGHPNWQHKLKDALPTVNFMPVESINKDLSFVDNLDLVVVNTAYFNHKFYRKLMAQMSRNQTSLHYINENTNIERNVSDIYQAIRK